MKTKISISILCLFIMLGGYLLLHDKFDKAKPQKKQAELEKQPEEQKAAAESEQEPAETPEDQADSVIDDLYLTYNMSELELVEIMHDMTHQKVKAREKWGAVPMIPETIAAVQDVIKHTEFEHKQELLEIVKQWKAGDFSQAVQQHNYFWEIQGGNVGDAYGLMSEEEEKKYIIKNFGEEFLEK
ncbi:DUF6241 domain-containing protein [Bacillus massiliglaciei]|uniref:DUF6241 domain-containing protein n=1 Tax=Bacillus massiliglaciei TaxID=1816693 RepID=UPI000DA63ADA|nr:DUF6241 domain-containing protein [Bacillus massiliglaciei]